MNVRAPSEAEISVLEALAAQAEPIATRPGPGTPVFRGRLRHVDPSHRFILVDGNGDADADAALLASAQAEFTVEWGEWRIVFVAGRPSRAPGTRGAAIRFDFPASVSINRRRMLERAEVPQQEPLRCVTYSGDAPVFEAIVTDVSQGGVGMQVESASMALEPGMVLPACRLEREGREAVIVDLEVRHTEIVTLADGRRVMRAGCRFQNLSPMAMGLVAQYFPTKPAPR